MTDMSVASTCPFDISHLEVATVVVSTDSGVLLLADPGDGEVEWEDFLLHGSGHSHHDGGFAIAGRSIGTHVPYDGRYTATLAHNSLGQIEAVTVSLQHIADTLHDVDFHSEPAANDAADGHGHGDHPDGWSSPDRVAASSDFSFFGDPAALLDEDESSLLRIQWPSAGGAIKFSSHAHNGFRDTLMFAWSPGA